MERRSCSSWYGPALSIVPCHFRASAESDAASCPAAAASAERLSRCSCERKPSRADLALISGVRRGGAGELSLLAQCAARVEQLLQHGELLLPRLR